MNRERLEDLIYLLENIKTELPQIDVFDINRWYQEYDEYYFGLEARGPLPHYIDKEKECGTAACALGAAALWPKFIEQGLRLSEDGNYPIFEEDYDDYSAGKYFFDLTKNQTHGIFNSYRYEAGEEVTPVMVAARVREVLEEANE